jgi:hypothetical protein
LTYHKRYVIIALKEVCFFLGEKKKEVEVNQDRTDELIRTGKEALDKAGRSHTSGTVYDDIFRLLLEKYPRPDSTLVE